MNEVRRSNENDDSTPNRDSEYLLGEFDFYKVVGIDNKNNSNSNLQFTWNIKPIKQRDARILL